MSEPAHARAPVDPVLRDARTWAQHWQGYLPSHVTSRAAAEVILSLPDTVIDGDALRGVLASFHFDPASEQALRLLLPENAPYTMVNVEWVDAVHAGTLARHISGKPVQMLHPHPSINGAIVCFWLTSEGRGTSAPLRADRLTPLPAPAPPSCTACPSG